ncbi:MAG: prepilin-type N-terminal cleavage/methylation domain-containing protein, partial [Synergistales bacterium]|nr:prepilin-type N-terminal cleavage/methylation domain-containing protein [Synergistales bacterium]
MFRFAKQRKGFSLVEVLIAMVILAIALLALAGVVVSTTMLMAHTIDKEKAVNLGAEKLETLEADYDGIVDSADAVGKFTRTWSV